MMEYAELDEQTQLAPGQAVSSTTDGEAREGFTIVELLVAIVILAIGVLGLAGTSAVVLQQMSGGNTQQIGSQIAASRFEKIAGRKCTGFAPSGTRYSRGVTETWNYAAADNGTMVATVTLNIQGRTQPEVYSTVISCF
jgi:prepilin-type N-terminal cleavage/methylation domain-containing protein